MSRRAVHPIFEVLEPRLLLDAAPWSDPDPPPASGQGDAGELADLAVRSDALELLTYYVSPTGSLAGDGTLENPWPSAEEALRRIGHGGVEIVLLPGTYGVIYIREYYAGTRDSPTVIRAADRWQAIVEGAQTAGISVAPGASWVVLDGLQVRGNGGTGIKVQADSNTVRNCWVHHNANHPPPPPGQDTWFGSGISVANAQGCLVEGNLVEHNGTSKQFDHGIYVGGRRHEIRANIVRHNTGYGLHLYPTLQDSVVMDNLIYGHRDKEGIILVAPAGGGRNHILRNTVVDNCGAIRFYYGTSDYHQVPLSEEIVYGNYLNAGADASVFDTITSNVIGDYAAVMPGWFRYGNLPDGDAAPSTLAIRDDGAGPGEDSYGPAGANGSAGYGTWPGGARGPSVLPSVSSTGGDLLGELLSGLQARCDALAADAARGEAGRNSAATAGLGRQAGNETSPAPYDGQAPPTDGQSDPACDGLGYPSLVVDGDLLALLRMVLTSRLL